MFSLQLTPSVFPLFTLSKSRSKSMTSVNVLGIYACLNTSSATCLSDVRTRFAILSWIYTINPIFPPKTNLF